MEAIDAHAHLPPTEELSYHDVPFWALEAQLLRHATVLRRCAGLMQLRHREGASFASESLREMQVSKPICRRVAGGPE